MKLVKTKGFTQKPKKIGKISNMVGGEGKSFFSKMFQFQFGNIGNPWGGLVFQQCFMAVSWVFQNCLWSVQVLCNTIWPFSRPFLPPALYRVILERI